MYGVYVFPAPIASQFAIPKTDNYLKGQGCITLHTDQFWRRCFTYTRAAQSFSHLKAKDKMQCYFAIERSNSNRSVFNYSLITGFLMRTTTAGLFHLKWNKLLTNKATMLKTKSNPSLWAPLFFITLITDKKKSTAKQEIKKKSEN